MRSGEEDADGFSIFFLGGRPRFFGAIGVS
jgi:hypothetical protein